MGADHAQETIHDIRVLTIAGSQHSNWILVAVHSESGITGWGEATTDGGDAHVLEAACGLRERLVGRSTEAIRTVTRTAAAYPAPLATNAVMGALDQAEWDIRGQLLGAPVWQLLGGDRASIPFYANLNRGIGQNRTPARFAACAHDAVAQGSSTVKIAPFDGVVRMDLEERTTRSLVDEGLKRVAAVREAVGPSVCVIIDCHWRFTPRTAKRVLSELEAFEPYWVEAPVSEHDTTAWRQVRDHTGLRLAGGEMLRSPRDFRCFLDASGVDIVMPDVKYCGGITGMLEVASIAQSFGVLVSPHSPSGPVGSIASIHATTAIPNFLIHEWPWGESAIRADLVKGAERFDGDRILVPSAPGLGLAIDENIAQGHPPGPAVRTVDDILFGPDRPFVANPEQPRHQRNENGRPRT